METSRIYYERLDSDSDYDDLPELVEDENEDNELTFRVYSSSRIYN
jgi:hypothetical protein